MLQKLKATSLEPVVGFQLVPIEPTPEMLKAPPNAWEADAKITYAAMLAAAPHPVQSEQVVEEFEPQPVGYFYFDEGNWKQANDPISFPGCTKLYKHQGSQTPSSIDLARLAPFVGGLGKAILKELMDATLQPAQDQTVDAARVLEWMRTQPRKAAQLAFTEGPDRQAAYWIEIAQSEKPPKRTKGETYQNVQLPLTEEQIDAALPSGIYDCLADPWDQGIGDGDEMHSIRADVLRIVRATEAAHDIPENGLRGLISAQESVYQVWVERWGQDNGVTRNAKSTLDVLKSLQPKQQIPDRDNKT